MQRVFILSLLGALAAGCVADHGDESFVIRDNLLPEENECLFTPESATLARGLINLESPFSYLLGALFESRIAAPEGKDSLRTIFIQGANVELLIGPTEIIGADDSVTIDDSVTTVQFLTPFSVGLAPNGGQSTGAFDLVPPSVLADLRTRFAADAAAGSRIHTSILATARAFGEYYGDRIEAAPFQFPITACNDCVVRSVFPDCAAIPADIETSPGNACNPFQDEVVDCCIDSFSGSLICPAVVEE